MQILILISISHPFSSLRLYDIRGWAAVCRVGPFLWHTSVPDHAGSHGAKQGQLGRLTAGAGSGLGGGRAQHGLRRHRRRCHRAEWRQHSYDRRRNQLQRNTSGKQRILTHSFCAISPQPRDPWGASGPQNTLRGPGGAPSGLRPCRCPTRSEHLVYVLLLWPPILINHWFYLIYLILIPLFFGIEQYIDTSFGYCCIFSFYLLYLFVHCSFGITDWTHHLFFFF